MRRQVMTVRELIEDLKAYDPNLPVARDACEGEGSGVRIVESVNRIRQATAPWDRDVMTVVLIQ